MSLLISLEWLLLVQLITSMFRTRWLRQQDQQRINETIRNNDMTNARGWATNNIAQQNVNLRRMELEDKKYDRLIANETNALKLAELQDKEIAESAGAMEQAKRDKADAYNSGMDNLSRTIETATKVLNSPGIHWIFPEQT